MATETPSVKPEVVFIEDLFDEIEAGNLRIPRFQRPYVWQPSDMLSLFDSILQGYPIGSLLFWETSEALECSESVGPFPSQSLRQAATPVSYVLDGHQRLVTLYGALRLPKTAPRGPSASSWRWWIWFNLRTRGFTHVAKGEPPPYYFPVGAALKTVDFLEEARRIQSQCQLDAERFIPEAERLAQQIKTYKIPVTRIRGGELSRAVEIFSRLNTRGRDMAVDQMVSALTYREGETKMDLAQRVDDILEALAGFNFGGVKRLTIVRSIVAASGNDIYKTEWEALAKRLQTAELERVVSDCSQALLKAAQFLNSEVGVIGDRFLPYTNQLLLLSQFFYHCTNPSPNQTALLAKWFWVSSFSGWFAGANTTQIGLAVEDMVEIARGNLSSRQAISIDDEPSPIPQNFDMRSARIRAMLLVLLKLKPRAPETNTPLSSSDLLGGVDEPALTHVFPRAPSKLVSHPANRVFLRKPPGISVRDYLLSLSSDSSNLIFKSHAISSESYEALVRSDAASFIKSRADTFVDIERGFMAQIGITKPTRPLAENESETEISADADT